MGVVKEKAPARSAVGRSAKGKAAGVIAAASGNGQRSAAAVFLPLDAIDAKHFTNPRGDVDLKSPGFAELVASISDLGVLQPIVVGPAIVGVGRHPIVAGWRRYAAATKLKLDSVPVRQLTDVVEAKDALVAAIAENAAREDVTPLAEARAIDTLMREHGYTQVAAGKSIGMAERTVRERLRLLKIHTDAPAAGEAINDGVIPMDAAVQLQTVAAAMPDLAELLVVLVRAGKLEASRITTPDGMSQILQNLAHDRRYGHGDPDVEIPLLVNLDLSLGAKELPLSPDQVKRWEAVPPVDQWERTPPRFDLEEHVEALTAAGLVLEFEVTRYGRTDTDRYLVKRGDVLDEILERELVAMEEAGVQRAAANARSKQSDAVAKGQAGAPGLNDVERQAALEEKDKQARARELAHRRNVILGERSAKAFEPLAGTLEAAKLIALLTLEREAADGMMTRGVRYCDAEYLTEKERKNGTVTRTYGLVGAEGLREQILAAETTEQAIAPVLRALALAVEANQDDVVAPSNRAYYYERFDHMGGPRGKMKGLLRDLIAKSGITRDIAKAAKAAAAKPAPAAAPAAALKTPTPTRSPASGKRPSKDELVELVKATPGITIPQLAEELGIKQNFLYRLLPELVKEKRVRKDGRGWHAVGA